MEVYERNILMIFTPANEGWGGIHTLSKRTQTRLMFDDLKVYHHIYTLLKRLRSR